jgi:hypothetical protein
MPRSSPRASEGVIEELAQTVRTERVLAWARVCLATCPLIAFPLDPAHPARYATLANLLLAAHLMYSGGVFGAVVDLTRHSQYGRPCAVGPPPRPRPLAYRITYV